MNNWPKQINQVLNMPDRDAKAIGGGRILVTKSQSLKFRIRGADSMAKTGFGRSIGMVFERATILLA